MVDEKDYDVGYGRPPKATQFKKGQSGNPKGRAKGSMNLETILNKAANEMARITVNGVPRMVPKMEVAITQAVNQAASGNLKALREVMGLYRLVSDPSKVQEPEKVVDDPAQDREVLQQLAARIREQFQDGGGQPGAEGVA